MDYYKILDVSRKATSDEIKKTYRQLALKYHPDKNESPAASAKFREVTEAYLVLSDEKRREIFDMLGEKGLKNISGHSAESIPSPSAVDKDLPSKIFSTVSGGKTDLMDELIELRIKSSKLKRRASTGNILKFSSPFKQRLIQEPSIYMDIHVSLEELYSGCAKKMKIMKKVLNPDQRTTKTIEKILTIDIKPGSKEGTKIIFPNEGDEKFGVMAADIVFVLKDQPHALYHRDSDNNLIHTITVNLRQALVGGVFEVPTLLPSRKLRFSTKDMVIKPKFVKVFPSEGLPLPEHPGEFGNLLLKFDIIFPEHITDGQRAVLDQILA